MIDDPRKVTGLVVHVQANEVEIARVDAMILRARLMARVEAIDACLAEVSELAWKTRTGAYHPGWVQWRIENLRARIGKEAARQKAEEEV